MINSVDPDQLASSEAKKKPTDLDLHCLQRQGIFEFSRTRVDKFKPFSTCSADRFKELQLL